MGPRKLYVDSRKRVSGSNRDFDYELPNPIQVPKSRCFVDRVHLANVFPTITSHSRSIYIQEISTANVSTKRKVGLTVGQNHDGTTLATEVALQLNTGTTLAANSYSCTFSSATGKLTLSNTTASPADFTIWPADYLKHDYGIPSTREAFLHTSKEMIVTTSLALRVLTKSPGIPLPPSLARAV